MQVTVVTICTTHCYVEGLVHIRLEMCVYVLNDSHSTEQLLLQTALTGSVLAVHASCEICTKFSNVIYINFRLLKLVLFSDCRCATAHLNSFQHGKTTYLCTAGFGTWLLSK